MDSNVKYIANISNDKGEGDLEALSREAENKQENEIDDGGDLEIIKVGTKLTGILRKLVFSNLEKAINADMDKVI